MTGHVLSKLALAAVVAAAGWQAAAGQSCKGTPPATDLWCVQNCFHDPPYCPADLCSCTSATTGATTTAAASTAVPTTTSLRGATSGTTTKAATTTALKTTLPATTTTKAAATTAAATTLAATTTKAAATTAVATTLAATTTPAATTTAAAGSGIYGFWYGYAGSASPNKAPSSGWLFNFPGLVVGAPFTAGSGYVPSNPSWGQYTKKVLTQGGGGTSWGNAVYTQLTASLSQYKAAGWDGVCWDWETVASDHTTAGFNAFMKATKAAGLLNIVTSTAEGPYEWFASSTDATGIDWTAVDYFVPQMYGADGTLPTGWQTYANYWVSGAGTANIHGVTFAAPPMSKVLWGMPAGTCLQASQFGGAGCVEWVYSPNVQR